MKRFKWLSSASVRRSVAMPLIFGLATIAAAPTVEAVMVNQVDIIGGGVDVNEDGNVDFQDTLANVLLFCNPNTPIRVDIIGGQVDVNENGAANVQDNLANCDLTDEGAGGFPATNQVDIIGGGVDVNESVVVNGADNATNIQLFVLP